MLTKTKFAFLAGCSALALAAPAWAAAADSGKATSVDEIVVTAQKREQNIKDVPVSITVAGQAQLERQQINTVSDLSRLAPSLEIQQQSGQNSSGGGQIRGLGTQTFALGAVGAVGLVVDGVSQGNVNITDLFDLARVEVLKGPQGTLFGLTASAGVINIVTNAPDPTGFSARIHTDLSNQGTAGSEYGNQVVQGVVNIPVSQNSALRLSGNMNLRQGVNHNTLDDSWDQHRSYGVRGHYLWSPNDQLTLNLIGDFSVHRDNGWDFFTVVKATPAVEHFFTGCGITPKEGNQDYCDNLDMPIHGKNGGLSGQIDYKLGDLTFTSITNYRKSTDNRVQGITRDAIYPLLIQSGPQLSNADLFSQEFRIASPTGSRFEYTVGAFYSNYDTIDEGAHFNLSVQPFPGFIIPIIVDSGVASDTRLEGLAAFGQGTFHVTDNFALIGGLRYQDDKLSIAETDIHNAAFHVEDERTENKLSWKVGAQYKFNPDVTGYATVAHGYKSAQFSVPDVTTGVINYIKPETPTDYEAGIKASTFDGRLFVDLNAFYINAKNFQSQVCIPVPTGLACVPTNVDAISKGVELNLIGKVAEGLTFNTGIIYNPVTFPQGYIGSDGSDLSGKQLTNAPKWKFTFSGEYSHPVSNSLDGFLAADTVYKSDVNLNSSNDPFLHYGPHWIVNGRIGVRTSDGRYSAAIFARNLFNEHEPVGAFPNFPDAGSYGYYYTPQSFRLVGVTLDASF